MGLLVLTTSIMLVIFWQDGRLTDVEGTSSIEGAIGKSDGVKTKHPLALSTSEQQYSATLSRIHND